MKKIALLTILSVLTLLINAQEKKNSLTEFITGNFGYKGAIISDNQMNSVHLFDCSFGFKFKNKMSIGPAIGSYYLFDYTNNSFDDCSIMGICFKYSLFELARNKDKNYSFEPYLTVYRDNERTFTFYDAGVNFIIMNKRNCLLGTGIMQNFYDDKRKSLLSWYFSVGIRM